MHANVLQNSQAVAQADHGEQFLANLLEEVTQALDAGAQVDVDEIVAAYPEHGDRLRELLATILAMASWGRAPDAKGGTGAASTASALEGVLGDFRILKEIGRGGMGTVYEAEQISMGRRVALKVLPFAGFAQDKALQRFRNEVRAAAALDHPHIVSVYAVGEERGIHYYAMRLVRGQSLADWVWQLRRHLGRDAPRVRADAPTIDSAETGPDDLTHEEQALQITVAESRHDIQRYRMAANWGIQAAEALQHAHDQGVLHRDIKPGNLLLDAEGQLYVTDFGLARIEADAGLTMTGDIVGTLRYMAPEQALAKRVVIDHRADIYGLGATLYELLTLQPAFGETDRSELLKQIAFEEPTSLCKIDRDIPVELETIVLKAMAKSPDERYETAQDLADDLQAYLEDRPIAARPPTLLQLAGKWSRRHVGMMAAAGLFLTVLALGSAAATFSLLAERERTNHAAAESVAVVDFLVNDLLAAPVEEKRENRELTVSDALSNAEARIDTAFGEQPLVEARIRQVIAETYLALRTPEKAESHARKALKLRTDLLGQSHEQTLAATGTLIETLLVLGNVAEARRIASESLRVVRAAYGGSSSETIEAMNRSVLTLLRSEQGLTADLQRAEDLNSEALRFGVAVVGEEHRHFLEAKKLRGDVLFLKGHEAEAEAIWKVVLKTCRNTLGPSDRLTIALTQSVASLLEGRAQRYEAMQLFEDLLESQREVLGERDAETLRTMQRLFQIYINIGHFQEAFKLAERGLAVSTSLYGNDSEKTWSWRQNEVYGLRGLQRRNEALNLQETVLKWCRHNLGTAHWRTIHAMQQLGYDYGFHERNGEALKLLDEAIDEGLTHLKQPEAITMDAMRERARILGKANRLPEAAQQLEELIELIEKDDSRNDGAMSKALIQLGEIRARDDRIEEASALFQRAIKMLPRNDWWDRNVLAWLLATTRHHDLLDGPLAIKLAKEACELTGYESATTLDTLAAAYARTGDFETACDWAEKAVDLASDPSTRGRYKQHLENFENRLPWSQSPKLPSSEEE